MGFQKTPTGRKRLWPEKKIPFLDNVKIILLHPKRGTNVGAAARAMNNFGFTNLWVAGEKKYDTHEAEYVAHDSQEIVKNIVHFQDINKALDGAKLIVGATAREMEYRKSVKSLKKAVEKIGAAAATGKVAVLFGPEWRGLSDNELERCSTIVTIPTGGPQPSLNLAQAVAIFCYELFCEVEKPPEMPFDWKQASADDIEGFWRHFDETLEYISFMPDTGKWRIRNTLRDMLYRTQPDEREVKILRGVLRKLTWYLKKVPKKQREEKNVTEINDE